MNRTDEYLLSAACCRVFHTIWFSELSESNLDEWRQGSCLQSWPEHFADCKSAIALIAGSVNNQSLEEIAGDQSQLYFGPGERNAYPWGSCYTDRDALLFAHTEQAFRQFCHQQNIRFELASHQPYDHFGLLMGTLSILFEQAAQSGNTDAVRTLIEQHIGDWGLSFLTAVEQYAHTGFYRGFSLLNADLLRYWQNILSRERQPA